MSNRSSASHTLNGAILPPGSGSVHARHGQESNSTAATVPRGGSGSGGQAMPVNNRARPTSIASRLFQFANSSVAETVQNHHHHHQGSPSYQSLQISQQESYSRLREHLFPSSSSSSTAAATSSPSSGSSIPTARHAQRPASATASSRFQQMVQSAVLHNSHSLADRLASSRDFYQAAHEMSAAAATSLTPPPPHPQSGPHQLLRNRGGGGGRRAAASASSIAAMHPSFRSKAVCLLECGFCSSEICRRGMRAILLADTSVELYSTDDVTKGYMKLQRERDCCC